MMFNHSLKKDALQIHQNAVDRYNSSHETMSVSCNDLLSVREFTLQYIIDAEGIINSISNSPKEFEKQLGEIREKVQSFHQTKEYGKQAYQSMVKSGVGIASGVAAAGAVATLTPTVAMSIATTFGTASTGTAISTLSGAAAQKAALAWIGRKTAGIATKGVITGAGMASGEAFLALAGPIGWGISAVSTAASLASMSSKNKKVAHEAIDEAKEIMKAREILDETTAKVNHLKAETSSLTISLQEQIQRAGQYRNADYLLLDEDAQLFLGSFVNNTLSLSALLNQTVQ